MLTCLLYTQTLPLPLLPPFASSFASVSFVSGHIVFGWHGAHLYPPLCSQLALCSTSPFCCLCYTYGHCLRLLLTHPASQPTTFLTTTDAHPSYGVGRRPVRSPGPGVPRSHAISPSYPLPTPHAQAPPLLRIKQKSRPAARPQRPVPWHRRPRRMSWQLTYTNATISAVGCRQLSPVGAQRLLDG